MRGEVPGHADATPNSPEPQRTRRGGGRFLRHGTRAQSAASDPGYPSAVLVTTDRRLFHEIRREPATPESAITTMIGPVSGSRLGVVVALVGTGLLMQGAADALERTGHGSAAQPLFLCGIALLFGACAWRLTGAPASRKERLLVALVLGLGLLASYAMRYPLLLASFDELDHTASLAHLLNSHAVFPANTLLPVSPYYPGLELATASTRWLTGLPLAVDELIVLVVVRVVLVLVVFLVVERACQSSRAGGIGVLVYAAGPQFYGFDSQYAYESLALAFGAAVVYLLLVSIDAPRPRKGRLFALALSCVAAVVITHHVTGWLTVGFLVVWAGALYLTTRSRRYRAPDVGEQSVISEDRPTVQVSTVPGHEQRSRRRGQARIIGIAAAVGLVVGGTWTALVGRRLIDYVGPVFAAASDNINQLLGNLHGNRQLFKNAAGGGSPKWEILLILASSVCFCLILVPSLYSVIFKRSVRGGALRYLPAVIAATYPISVLANVSSYSKLVAERADTFIFFGVAVVVGAWLAGRISRRRRMLERIATIAVATVCFLGSLLFGAGPLATLLPGPYRVGADELSLGSPSLAVAHWADTHLPAGSHVAADRDNGALLNAIGGVVPVTAEGGLVNPASLFFDRRLSPFDISLVRQADIRYVVVDDRLAKGLPLYGIYVAYGEPHARLTLEELNKFSSYPGIKRIYDNGPIQVYDLSQLFPPSPQAAPAGAPVGGSGLDVGAFVLFVLVAVLWMLRLRRRTEPFRHVEHLAVCGLVGALVVGVFGAFLVRLTARPARRRRIRRLNRASGAQPAPKGLAPERTDQPAPTVGPAARDNSVPPSCRRRASSPA